MRLVTARNRFTLLTRTVAACVGVATLLTAALPAHGQVNVFTVNNNYHYQVYNNWCASASVEMMLDCPAVTGSNSWLTTSSFADAPAVAANGARPTPTFQNIAGVNYVNSNMQAFIYGLNHGANTFNGQTYNNLNVPYGVGSDSAGVLFDLQMIDNPSINGSFGPAFGNHAYSGYDYYVPNTLLAAAAATRTIVNCMNDYNVPAQIVVESGAHSIIANGAITTGTPGNGNNYTIQYIRVSDPWTGYAIQQPGSSGGSFGLGFNTWLRYGYDVLGNGQGIAITLPNGTVVPNARMGAWFNYYNLSPGQSSPGFYGAGYKFTVEPQGPESLDTGDPSFDGSLPAPPSLNADTTASQAIASASLDLSSSANSAINSALLSSGTGSALDLNTGDTMLLTGSGAESGDWLVPYDGSGGVNDVTGALLIDPYTGVIDEATWIDPTADGISSMSLSQLDTMYEDNAAGATPNDLGVPVPEPTALSLLAGGALLAAGRWYCRRRKRAGTCG